MNYKNLFLYVTIGATVVSGIIVYTRSISDQKIFLRHTPISRTTIDSEAFEDPKTYQLFTDFELLEDQIHPDRDIITNDNYTRLLELLENRCPSGTKQKGTEKYNEMIDYAVNVEKVSEVTTGGRIALTAEKFEKYYSDRPNYSHLPLDQFCVQRYATVLYQKILTEKHIEYLLESGIIDDFTHGTNHENKKTNREKTNLLNFIHERDKESFSHQLDILDDSKSFTKEQQQQLDLLNKEDREHAEIFISIAKTKIVKYLTLLSSMNILDHDDVIRLADQINLIIPTSCSNRDAYYKYSSIYEIISQAHADNHQLLLLKISLLKEVIMYYEESTHYFKYTAGANEIENVITKNGKVIKFHGITFNIPICDSYNNLIQFSSVLDHTILHEIGHYYYDRKDPNPEAFHSFCRDTIHDKDAITCKNSQFVSEYAKESPQEDYAESFANVIEDILYHSPDRQLLDYSSFKTVPQKKNSYFHTLFMKNTE